MPTPVAPLPDPATASGPNVSASAAIVVDLGTNQVMWSRNADVERPPASMTKVITALVVRDAFTLDELITITPASAAVGGSGLDLKPGSQYTVEQLLYALMMKSANDVAFALADHYPGGATAFIDAMNAKAASLGANHSHFANPHGLDAPGHYSSAADMAKFGRQLLSDPVLAKLVSTKRNLMTLPDGRTWNLVNHNKLLGSDPRAYGIKTGYTRGAGQCLVAAAHTEKGDFLTVVMDAKPASTSQDTKALWDWATANPVDEGSNQGTAAILAAPPRLGGDQIQAFANSGEAHRRTSGASAHQLAIGLIALIVATSAFGRKPRFNTGQIHR